MNYTDRTINSISQADAGISKVSQAVLELDGMSSNRTRHFFNNLIKEDTRYLEIGTWKGSTLISALYDNNPEYHIAIDNFIQFAGPRLDFHKNCRQLLKYQNRANFLDADCFNINPKDFGIETINTYFYDGEHSYENQRKAINHYYSCLTEEFILIVDDYNWEEVQRGTIDGLKDKNIEVKYQVHLPADTVSVPGPHGPMIFGDKELWWNGLFVAHCKKL